MCFSVEADLIAGAVVAPLGVLALREVREPRELPLASLPLLFAAHQFTEALVWAGASGTVSETVAHRAAVAYAVVALPLLPLVVPVMVALAARPDRRRWAWPFAVLGLVVSAQMALHVADGVRTTVHPHAIVYHVGLDHPVAWTAAYIAATMGGAVLSGHRWLVAFGVANLVGLTVVGLAYRDAFASLWCAYAALSSVLVLVHLARGDRDQQVGPRPDRVATATS